MSGVDAWWLRIQTRRGPPPAPASRRPLIGSNVLQGAPSGRQDHESRRGLDRSGRERTDTLGSRFGRERSYGTPQDSRTDRADRERCMDVTIDPRPWTRGSRRGHPRRMDADAGPRTTDRPDLRADVV